MLRLLRGRKEGAKGAGGAWGCQKPPPWRTLHWLLPALLGFHFHGIPFPFSPSLALNTSSESPETEPVCGRVSRAGLLAGMVELGSETGSIQTHCPVGSQGVGKELPPLCPAAMELYW